MSIIISIVILLISATIFTLYQLDKKKAFQIRIGRRGSSVIASEMPFDNNFELVGRMISFLRELSDYQIYLVCSGVNDKAPNRTISEREYFIGKLTTEEAEKFEIKMPFKDISIFLLNEEVEETDKILLTHDLIVNSAQIPDRELLLESGFIVTLIAPSNLIIVTGVRGTFERLLLNIFEYFSGKDKKIILSKM
jgi:hypothetical protein